MKDKKKTKGSHKKDLKKQGESVCYDLCDPCIDYYVVDSCGCFQ